MLTKADKGKLAWMLVIVRQDGTEYVYGEYASSKVAAYHAWACEEGLEDWREVRVEYIATRRVWYTRVRTETGDAALLRAVDPEGRRESAPDQTEKGG